MKEKKREKKENYIICIYSIQQSHTNVFRRSKL